MKLLQEMLSEGPMLLSSLEADEASQEVAALISRSSSQAHHHLAGPLGSAGSGQLPAAGTLRAGSGTRSVLGGGGDGGSGDAALKGPMSGGGSFRFTMFGKDMGGVGSGRVGQQQQAAAGGSSLPGTRGGSEPQAQVGWCVFLGMYVLHAINSVWLSGGWQWRMHLGMHV
jgi:hypothetical protein